MPNWAGKWKGGRFYLDGDGRKTFVIEKRAARVTGTAGSTKRYVIKLRTHDEDLAVGELARFLADPVAFERSLTPAPASEPDGAVFITAELMRAYMEHIGDAVMDHRKARRAYLLAWSKLGIDLRSVNRERLRAALGSFTGGHRGRTEALNAFARFLVAEGHLPSWTPLVCRIKSEQTRAEREAYSVEQLQATYAAMSSQRMRDVFRLRVASGMHFTELAQLEGCDVVEAPLPDAGAAIRVLPVVSKQPRKGRKGRPAAQPSATIAGVLQVMHKSRNRHRVSVDAASLAAALRLRESVPSRISVWKAFGDLVPSNLRHTFATLSLEVGQLVTPTAGGIDPIAVQRALGHAVGSSMLRDRYSKVQVPPMTWLPLDLTHPDDPPLQRDIAQAP